MTAQVAADLRAAADVLERDGWTQGTIIDGETGARCVYGAICDVVNRRLTRVEDFDSASFDSAFGPATDRLAVFLHRAPAVWNDESGRTADEVVATLRAAADAVEARS